MDNLSYVRVTPYNKATGALAMRVAVDGKVFVSGNWYTVSAEVGAKLRKMKQDSGAPYFEVMDKASYKEAARSDLAAIATAAGLKGFALRETEIREPAPVDKKARTQSEYAGIGKQVKDVNPGSLATADAILDDVDDSDIVDEPTEEVPDIDNMKRDELVELCKKNDIKVPFGSSNNELKKSLRDNGIA